MRGLGGAFYSSQMILRLSPLTPVRKLVPPCFARMYYKHKEDPLYVPFATDAERELASIRFWVSKNTNLKGVNVNCRVGASEAKLMRSMLTFHSGVFLLIAISTSTEDAQFLHTLIKIQSRERDAKFTEERTITINLCVFAVLCSHLVGRGQDFMRKRNTSQSLHHGRRQRD